MTNCKGEKDRRKRALLAKKRRFQANKALFNETTTIIVHPLSLVECVVTSPSMNMTHRFGEAIRAKIKKIEIRLETRTAFINNRAGETSLFMYSYEGKKRTLRHRYPDVASGGVKWGVHEPDVKSFLGFLENRGKLGMCYNPAHDTHPPSNSKLIASKDVFTDKLTSMHEKDAKEKQNPTTFLWFVIDLLPAILTSRPQ